MIRKGYYCKYKDKIFRCGILKDQSILLRSNDYEDAVVTGFIKYPNYNEKAVTKLEKYMKKVPQKDVEWFCRIETRGYYKGYKVWVSGETDTEYSICSGPVSADQKVFTKENGFQEMDRYLFIGEVPKNEITGIFEIKTPINEKYKAPDNWDF